MKTQKHFFKLLTLWPILSSSCNFCMWDFFVANFKVKKIIFWNKIVLHIFFNTQKFALDTIPLGSTAWLKMPNLKSVHQVNSRDQSFNIASKHYSYIRMDISLFWFACQHSCKDTISKFSLVTI